MHDKKLYGTATVGTKGQVVIPADAREELDIKPGDKLYVAGSPGKKALFLIKEEQLRALIDHFTDSIESVKSALDSNDKKEK